MSLKQISQNEDPKRSNIQTSNRIKFTPSLSSTLKESPRSFYEHKLRFSRVARKIHNLAKRGTYTYRQYELLKQATSQCLADYGTFSRTDLKPFHLQYLSRRDRRTVHQGMLKMLEIVGNLETVNVFGMIKHGTLEQQIRNIREALFDKIYEKDKGIGVGKRLKQFLQFVSEYVTITQAHLIASSLSEHMQGLESLPKRTKFPILDDERDNLIQFVNDLVDAFPRLNPSIDYGRTCDPDPKFNFKLPNFPAQTESLELRIKAALIYVEHKISKPIDVYQDEETKRIEQNFFAAYLKKITSDPLTKTDETENLALYYLEALCFQKDEIDEFVSRLEIIRSELYELLYWVQATKEIKPSTTKVWPE